MKKAKKTAPGSELVLHPGLYSDYGIPWTNVHLGRLERRGRFPMRVKLGTNSVAWVRAEVEAWIELRKRARQPASETRAP
jgi:hypothetical protein